MELDKEKLISNKHKEDSKKMLEEFTSLQEMYDKTSIELSKTKDMEIKLKEDYERATYDLEMCRERFDKCQTELRSTRQEKDKSSGECDRLALDLERAAAQHNKAQVGLEKSQEEVARLQVYTTFIPGWQNYQLLNFGIDFTNIINPMVIGGFSEPSPTQKAILSHPNLENLPIIISRVGLTCLIHPKPKHLIG